MLEDEENASKLNEVVEKFTKELEEVLSDFEVEAYIKPFSSCHTSESALSALETAVDSDPSLEMEGVIGPPLEMKDATDAPPDAGVVPDTLLETEVALDSNAGVTPEHEHNETTTGDSTTSPDTENTNKVEIIAIPTGKKSNKPVRWRESLLTQVIAICQRRTISKLMQLEDISWGKIIKKLKKGVKVGVAAGAIGGASGASIGVKFGSAFGDRAKQTIRDRLGSATAAAIGSALTAPVGGVGTLPVSIVVGSLLGSFGGDMLVALTGGISSAYNSNLFRDIMFYYKVQKKLKELQKKGQNH